MSGEKSAVRAYRLLVQLLPAPVRERDGDEMVAAFAAMWADAPGILERIRIVALSFGRLPIVALAEWWDHLRTNRRGRRGGVLERTRRLKMQRLEWVWVVRSAFLQTIRTMRRHPGYALGVILTLGLGVGANAAMFRILDRLLFQPPMHVVDHEQVKRVIVERTLFGMFGRVNEISYPDFDDLRKHDGFTAVAPYRESAEATLGSGPEATRVRRAQVGYEFFPLLGARPTLGRFYGAEEDREGVERTAVISHEYWRRAFGGSPMVLGNTLEITGRPYTIIGVAPRGFTGVDLAPVDVWLPLRVTNTGDERYQNRLTNWISAVVRLAEDAQPAAAEERATALHHAGRQQLIERGTYQARVALDPLIQARGPGASAESKVARWLGGVSLIVLLIVCANVANLLLARGTRRRREVSMRLALGAERMRVVAELVGEALVLTLFGGGLALLLAIWGAGALREVLLPEVAFPGPAVDSRLLLFTAIAAIVAGFASALGPAIQSTRVDLARDLTGSAGSSLRRSPTRALLTAGQAALAAVLLVGAGLFVKSVSEVHRLDLGLDVDQLALVRLEVGQTVRTRAELAELYTRAIERLHDVPGVLSAAGTSTVFESASATRMRVPGWDSLPQLPGGGPYYQYVTDGYFSTVGLRIVQGRVLSERDGPGDAKVAVVSETMSRTLWPEGNVLGQCLYLDGQAPPPVPGEPPPPVECRPVVGVVEDASRGSLEEDAYMAYYLPSAQGSEGIGGVYIRTAGSPRDIAGAAAAALRSLDPSIRFATVRPLRDILDPQARSWTLGAWMFTTFGALALVVAAIGLYSVLAFDVAQSTREIGIRSALGAERRRLLVSVLLRGLGMVVTGVAVGLAITWAAAPYVSDLLFHVSPRDPVVLAVATASLLAVALAASLLPGLRATRIDAMAALRQE
jgi:predicted permease